MNEVGFWGSEWTENVIVVDAEYADRVAFDLTVNFERMIGRRIPPADLACWVDCVALDGGVKPSKEASADTTVVLVSDGKAKGLEYFTPSDFQSEINGYAFRDNLGEFSFVVVTHEGLSTKRELMADIVEMTSGQKAVKRLMIVPDGEDAETMNLMRNLLRNIDDDKRTTLFTMQPMAGTGFRQEILGYSLMKALGIRAEEIK